MHYTNSFKFKPTNIGGNFAHPSLKQQQQKQKPSLNPLFCGNSPKTMITDVFLGEKLNFCCELSKKQKRTK